MTEKACGSGLGVIIWGQLRYEDGRIAVVISGVNVIIISFECHTAPPLSLISVYLIERGLATDIVQRMAMTGPPGLRTGGACGHHTYTNAGDMKWNGE
jgi:hypothetical protein